jgi:crossover junction endodeoxyribonuclease RuvC
VADRIRILGIDPGSRVTGFGVIDSDGVRSELVESGCIRLDDGDFAVRLGRIYAGLRGVLERLGPVEVAVEQVFVAHNAQSALKLGHARGAAICAAVAAGLPVYEYSPREVKQAVVGTGGADKTQVQHMVRRLLAIDAELAADAADALAVALSHAHGRTARALLARRPARGGR